MTQQDQSGYHLDNVYTIHPSMLTKHWPYIQPMLHKALKYSDGKHDIWDLYKGLSNTDMQGWYLEDYKAVAITQVVTYPQKKVLELIYLVGKDMNDWLDCQDVLAKWGKSIGCDSMEAYCRPGWERVLDWEKIHTVLRRKL